MKKNIVEMKITIITSNKVLALIFLRAMSDSGIIYFKSKPFHLQCKLFLLFVLFIFYCKNERESKIQIIVE